MKNLMFLCFSMIVILISCTQSPNVNEQTKEDPQTDNPGSTSVSTTSEIVKSGETSSNDNFKTYTNSSRNFTIDYPSFLTMGSESENGDGRDFINNGGEIKIIASSSNFTENEGSMENRYKDDLNSDDYDITYKRSITSNWYVVSGTIKKNDKAFYIKVYFSNLYGPQIRTLYMEYPKNKKREFDNIIPIMLKSFKDI